MESSRSAGGTWSNTVLKGNMQTTGDIVIILSEKYQMNMSQSTLGIICGREQELILELYRHVKLLMCSLSDT